VFADVISSSRYEYHNVGGATLPDASRRKCLSRVRFRIDSALHSQKMPLFGEFGAINVGYHANSQSDRPEQKRARGSADASMVISISCWKVAEMAEMFRGKTSRNRADSRFGENLKIRVHTHTLFPSRLLHLASVHLYFVYRYIGWSMVRPAILSIRERERERDFRYRVINARYVIKISRVLHKCPARCSVTFGEFVGQFYHKSRFPLRWWSRISSHSVPARRFATARKLTNARRIRSRAGKRRRNEIRRDRDQRRKLFEEARATDCLPSSFVDARVSVLE